MIRLTNKYFLKEDDEVHVYYLADYADGNSSFIPISKIDDFILGAKFTIEHYDPEMGKKLLIEKREAINKIKTYHPEILI